MSTNLSGGPGGSSGFTGSGGGSTSGGSAPSNTGGSQPSTGSGNNVPLTGSQPSSLPSTPSTPSVPSTPSTFGGQTQPGSTTPGAEGQPSPSLPSPALDPKYNWEVLMQQHGGEQGVKRHADFYNLYASDKYNPSAFLDHLSNLSGDRYNALVKDVYDNHSDYFRQQVLGSITSNPQERNALLQSLGWNQQDYESYRQYLQSGKQGQGQQQQPNESVEQKAMRERLEALEGQNTTAQQQQFKQQVNQQVDNFSNSLMEPINNVINQLNLPATKEGGIAKAAIIGCVREMFSSNQDAMGLMQKSIAHFERGEFDLGHANDYRLKQAVDSSAREVFAWFKDALTAKAELEQLRLQMGGNRISPAGNDLGRSTAAPNGTQNNSPKIGGELSYETLKAELPGFMAQRRGGRF